MKLLRETIRKLIIEAYELTDSDVAAIQKDGRFMRGAEAFDKEWPEGRIRKHYDRRGQGYQGTESTKRDINVMKAFNQSMNTNTKGKQIIKDFQSGTIQILHSIHYEGIESSKKEFVTSNKPFTLWLSQFGKRGKDMVSVVASPAKYNESPQIDKWPENYNAEFVYDIGYGFLMKGYPAFIANEDVMSQTLSAVPQSLKNFQKSSGVAKRAGRLDYAVTIDDWLDGIGSEETLLDNWTVIGVYIGSDHQHPAANEGKYEDLVRDAKATGLPVYQVSTDRSLVKIA